MKLLLAAVALFAMIGIPVLIALGAIVWQVLSLRSKSWARGLDAEPTVKVRGVHWHEGERDGHRFGALPISIRGSYYSGAYGHTVTRSPALVVSVGVQLPAPIGGEVAARRGEPLGGIDAPALMAQVRALSRTLDTVVLLKDRALLTSEKYRGPILRDSPVLLTVDIRPRPRDGQATTAIIDQVIATARRVEG